jgi:hypothetical protein
MVAELGCWSKGCALVKFDMTEARQRYPGELWETVPTTNRAGEHPLPPLTSSAHLYQPLLKHHSAKLTGDRLPWSGSSSACGFPRHSTLSEVNT